MAKNAVVDLGKLSKPAEVLINRVSDAIGASLLPWQMRRIASAEADIDRTKLESKIECAKLCEAAGFREEEIGYRTLNRMLHEETQKQLNIETITTLAIENLSEDAKPEDIAPDFITNFFSKCRNVSDKDMQSFWARLLAGEANDPGSISKRTLAIVDQLEKKDAVMFTKFCSTVCTLNDSPLPFFTARVQKIMFSKEFTFENIAHLESLGFLKFLQTGFSQTLSKDEKEFEISYFDKRIVVVFKNSLVALDTGSCILTEAGRQLSRFSGAKPDDSVFDTIIKDCMHPGSLVFSPL